MSNNKQSNKIKLILDWLSKKFDEFIFHSNKRTDFQNSKWYVIIALLSSIIWLLIWLYTLIIPISNIMFDVNNLSKDISSIKYNYASVYNEQFEKTSKTSWWELIKKYISSLNSGQYQIACSLISTLHCTMYDVKWFTNWVENKKRYLTVKLNDWETLINTWDTWINLENTKINIWCAEVQYYMNTETRSVKEIRQYYISNRPDKNKEIWKILCEYAEKDWNNRTKAICWYELENKVCTR